MNEVFIQFTYMVLYLPDIASIVLEKFLYNTCISQLELIGSLIRILFEDIVQKNFTKENFLLLHHFAPKTKNFIIPKL